MDGLNSRMKTEESGSMKAELKLFSLNRRKKKRDQNFFKKIGVLQENNNKV